MKTENLTPPTALEILGLERAALDSWPALESARDGLWLRRAANGYSKRSNSITILGKPAQGLSDALAAADHWLRERRLPVVYRLVEPLIPDALDARLQARGDRVVDPSEVWTRSLETIDPTSPPEPVVLTTPDNWLAVYGHCAGKPERQLAMHKRLLERLALPAGWFTIHRDNVPVGCALVVLHTRLAGVFDVVVHPDHRRQGVASALMDGALAWATQQGAQSAYLQMVAANDAARRLYTGMGFQSRYRYWYRVSRTR